MASQPSALGPRLAYDAGSREQGLFWGGGHSLVVMIHLQIRAFPGGISSNSELGYGDRDTLTKAPGRACTVTGAPGGEGNYTLETDMIPEGQPRSERIRGCSPPCPYPRVRLLFAAADSHSSPLCPLEAQLGALSHCTLPGQLRLHRTWCLSYVSPGQELLRA